MPTLDWLNREDAFRLAARVPTRVLRPHAQAPAIVGDAASARDNLLVQGDNLEHSAWLTMMLPRLQLLREFLREDGSIWVTIDDNEGHYLKVLMDEVFGRGNFVASVLWQKVFSPKNTARHLSAQRGKGDRKGSGRPGMGRALRGRCLFAMVFKERGSLGVAQQIDAAVVGAA
jgi:adenine-specific DNA-methyltransferase